MTAKKYLMVTVDVNDADYYSGVFEISDADLRTLMPLISAINAFKPYRGSRPDWTHMFHNNYPFGEYSPRVDLGEKEPSEIYPDIDPDTLAIFEESFVPYPEHGFRTIHEIRILEVVSDTTLLHQGIDGESAVSSDIHTQYLTKGES